MTEKRESKGGILAAWHKVREPFMKGVFLVAACVSILAVALI